MKTARTNEEHRGLVVERIALVVCLEGDRAVHGIAQMKLAIEAVRGRRTVRVLEVRHEHARTRVERVDDHLAIDWPRDLHTTIQDRGGQRRTTPSTLTHRARLRQEAKRLARSQPHLTLFACSQSRIHLRAKATNKLGNECHGLGCEERVALRLRSRDLNTSCHQGSSMHRWPPRSGDVVFHGFTLVNV